MIDEPCRGGRATNGGKSVGLFYNSAEARGNGGVGAQGKVSKTGKKKGGLAFAKPPSSKCLMPGSVHQLLHQIDELQRLQLGALFIVNAA